MREQLDKDMKYMKERIENYKEECNDTRQKSNSSFKYSTKKKR